MILFSILLFLGSPESDSKVVDLFRKAFEVGQVSMENSAFDDEAINALHLEPIKALGFSSKDLWGNRDYVFGYGTLRDGSLVMVAWKARADAPAISLKDLSGIYTEERLGAVEDDKGLQRWRKMREEVAGAMISVRKSEVSFTALYPQALAKTTGRDALNKLELKESPVVIRFHLQRKKNDLGSLVGSVEKPGIR